MAAAIDTIAELGYGQASLARIAEAAGTSKGVIIYHFGGKDELIKELLQELIARAGTYMRPRIEAEQTGAGMLRAFIESNLQFMAENRNHVAATVEIALNARAGLLGFDPRAHVLTGPGDQLLEQLLDELVLAAEMVDDHPLARVSGLRDARQRSLPVSELGNGVDGGRHDLRPPRGLDERPVRLLTIRTSF